MLMCGRHWQGVTMQTRRDLHAAHRPGQEILRQWTLDYLKAANRARVEAATRDFPAATVNLLKRRNATIETIFAREAVKKLKREFSERG
jgi:hypothetical protein